MPLDSRSPRPYRPSSRHHLGHRTRNKQRQCADASPESGATLLSPCYGNKRNCPDRFNTQGVRDSFRVCFSSLVAIRCYHFPGRLSFHSGSRGRFRDADYRTNTYYACPMLQRILIALLSVTTALGPLVCCCTLQALDANRRCCSSHQAQPDAAKHRPTREAPSSHHGCHGHHHGKHHSSAAAEYEQSSSPPVPNHPPCPCGPTQRNWLAMPVKETGTAGDSFHMLVQWLTCSQLTSDRFSLESLSVAGSTPSPRSTRFETGQELLRAYCIQRC